MKATGIVRRIDDLGRVVIPKEIRRTLRIRESDPMEIFTDREGQIILKKYSPIGELNMFAKEYTEALAQAAGCIACIADKDQIIAAAGNGWREYEQKTISRELEEQISDRKNICAAEQKEIYQNYRGRQNGICVSGSMDNYLCGRCSWCSDYFGKEVVVSLRIQNQNWHRQQQDFWGDRWNNSKNKIDKIQP